MSLRRPQISKDIPPSCSTTAAETDDDEVEQPPYEPKSSSTIIFSPMSSSRRIPRLAVVVVLAVVTAWRFSVVRRALVSRGDGPKKKIESSFRATAAATATATASNAYSKNNHDDDDVLDFELASNESFGFFADISSRDWEEMRTFTLGQRRRRRRRREEEEDFTATTKTTTTGASGAAASSSSSSSSSRVASWYARNWDPDFSCPNVARVGRGDGAKWVCDIDRLVAQSRKRKERYNAIIAANHDGDDGDDDDDENAKNKPGCLIYSVGSNGQFNFEESVKERLGDACEVHTFDFDDFSHKIPPGLDVHFHAWGLKPSYGDETLGVSRDGFGQRTADDGKSYGLLGSKLISGGEFRTLRETMSILGHTGLPIDIFKIDCEGCEWGTYRDWIVGGGDGGENEEEVVVDARQILVEVHSLPEVAPRFFKDIQEAGYVIFHKEMNIQWFWEFWDALLGRGRCVEYAFLKLDPSFVEDRLDRGI